MYQISPINWFMVMITILMMMMNFKKKTMDVEKYNKFYNKKKIKIYVKQLIFLIWL